MEPNGQAKITITFLIKKEELDRVEAVFTELKLATGLKKNELYGKALEWIANNEIAKTKFIEYILSGILYEKAKDEIMEIKE